MHSFYLKSRAFIGCFLLCGLVSACGGGSGSSNGENYLRRVDRAYKTDSPYREYLNECLFSVGSDVPCALSVVPMMGMEHEVLTVSDIMDRVGVSHDWMGDRLEEVLLSLPEETLQLFKPLTAIFITSDIRPAYYDSRRSEINLDPIYLWQSLAEKRTISQKEDYRSSFDDMLGFRVVRRYVINGQPAYLNPPLAGDETREFEEMVMSAIRVLFHELAHANDIFSPPILPVDLDELETFIPTFSFDDLISLDLVDTHPLENDELNDLARVMFIGHDPTLEQIDFSSDEVGESFSQSGAADLYSFSTMFEDTAMLFEASLMKFYFDADYEIAFTSVPNDTNICSDYLIGWGQRNRLADENVRVRAEFITEALMPDVDFGNFFDSMEAPISLQGDWCIESFGQGSQKAHSRNPQGVDWGLIYH